jgi:uncharacterized membrane protein YhaH (DUF805 family)
MDFNALLLSVHGRIGRASYWLGTLILAAVSVVVIGIAIALEGISDEAVVASMAAGLAIAYPTYALMAKRFQDRGKPGTTALFGLVPIYGINLLQSFGVIDPFDPTPLYHVLNYAAIGLSLWLLIELGFLKGTQGPNRYGPDPLGKRQADATL